MTPIHKMRSIGLIISFLPALAMADTEILERGAWTLWEQNNASGDICYMQTVDSVLFRKEDFLLEIHKAKNKPGSPVEILAKINKNKRSNTGLSVQVAAAGTQLGFSDLTGNKDLFWALPKNLSALIKQLQDGQNVGGKAIGGTKEIDVDFNSDGFSEVMAVFEKQCNGGFALIDKRFEADLLGSAPNSVDPTKLNSSVTVLLRNAYFAAFDLHSKGLEAESQLRAVLSKYQAFIDEQKVNRSEKQQITSVDLPTSQKTLTDSQKAQVDLRSEIARLTQLIPDLNDQVVKSQKILDQAKAVLAPLVPEFNRLTSQVRSAQQTLSDSQNRLAEIDQRLREISREISDLSSEADQLERRIWQRRSEIDRATSELRDAEFRRAQFDVRREIDRRLQANGEYSRLVSERQNIEPELSSARSLLGQLQGERSHIATELDSCRKEVGKDCSEAEQGLARVDQLIADKQTQIRNLESRRGEVERAIDNLESSIERDVRRDFDQLVERENNARRELRRLEDDNQRDQSRLNSIRGSQLPQLSNEQRSLSNERPGVLSRISQAQQQLSRAEQDLNQFRSVNDWDRKASDVDNKERKLAQDQSQLNQALSAKSAFERRLQDAIETEARMKKRISDLNARVVVLDARNVDLDKALKNLPAERAPIDARIAALKKQMASKRDEILNLLKG